MQLQLRADDLRVKQFRAKAGALFCFAVDASGSMALHRMRQAKGAVHALLLYRPTSTATGSRCCRFAASAPTCCCRRRRASSWPAARSTCCPPAVAPLAAALLSTIEIAKQARGRGIMQTVLVLLTDGRANVGVRADRDGIAAELQQLDPAHCRGRHRAIVVDTQRSYLSRGEAQKLAGWLGGTYIYLPNTPAATGCAAPSTCAIGRSARKRR
ncbi:MAG: hypothetical protein U0Z44_03990 [Kouleothrix sp.]